MKGNSPDSNQPSFLLPSLKEQLDPNHPIYQLNERINWSVIEEDFKKLYSHTGRPAKPVRLMVSLLLLKQLEDLSDEQVIRRWVDIPYWQYLSGETHFQWKPPAASSDLTHFRKRIGKKGAERLLKLSIDLFNPKIQKEEVVIDTTVQEKNITYPTDSKLAKKVIDTCRNIANQEGIPLRQSYSRVTPQLLRQASNRKSPQQKKRPGRQPGDCKPSVVPWFVNWSARCPKNKSVLMPKPCWMPGASCFKTKPINIKFIAFTNPMSVVFPKAKPINLLNSAAKSRSPEPVTVELFWEPWHCLEILTMATRFKTPLSKSKESLENSRKSSSQTGVTKAKRNLAKPVC